ncbi:MAG: histidine-type phosphatase [Bacteroidales bacterium]|nr:histidine-type phosphatase [Bacteroidales bacterium]
MTRKILLLPLLLALSLSAAAQQPDILDQLRAHPEYLSGTDYLCPTGPVALTPAPKGYDAFYVSHYGRHGARYAWQSDLYDKLHDLFGAAAAADNLTPLGVSFRTRFESLYPEVRYRVGDLSRKGWRQQQELAARMYANYPKAFPKGAEVRARTSTSTRCIMTMSAFCLGLQAQDPTLDIYEHFGVSYLPAILPLDRHNPFRNEHYVRTPLRFPESWEQYIERTVDWRAILARLFKEPFQAVPEAEGWDLVSYLYFFAGGMAGIDTDLDFTDIFTPEERIALWKVDNFQFYANAWPTHLGYRPIVDDMIAQADARIASGKPGADLRFGHDYTFLPLLMTLDVNGFGHDVTDPDEIPVWCQLHEVPMGANLHFVFFRSKRSPKILFKVLLNGREARLPLETDAWPYYDWDAFKQRFDVPVMGEATIVQTSCPEVSGLSLRPDGDGLLAASDENGLYSIDWNGETNPFFVTKTWMDCEAVTMDPQTRDVYYVVEGKQEVRRLRGPNYDKSELITVISEVGMGTNSGLEAITWAGDGILLIGNQANPSRLFRYSLRDGILARTDLTCVDDISDLYYDPVRDRLWIADSERRTVEYCTPEGEVLATYPVPFIENGEGLYVDHAHQCIWVGDDTTSRLYKISFSNL